MSRPCNYREDFLDDFSTEFAAYFLGLWIADGDITTQKIRITLKDKQLIDLITKRIKFKNKLELVKSGYTKKMSCYRITIGGKPVKIIRALGFTGKKTGNEFVPKCINELNFNVFNSRGYKC